MWLRIYQHLLFKSKFWTIVVTKQLRQLFAGLAGWPRDARDYVDTQYNALDPQLTTVAALNKWLVQFGIDPAGLTDSEKRSRLDAAWKEQGGQDLTYIQNTLQARGFNVYVHEWWVPGVLHPAGGQVNGDEPPVARNPYTYLYDGIAPPSTVGDGHNNAQDGYDNFQDGNNNNPPGYVLVNLIQEVYQSAVWDGHVQAVDGADAMADGNFVLGFRPKQYALTATVDEYPYFLYIGGESFPNLAAIPNDRREEFEKLVLKICPTEQWLGMLIEYI